MRRFITQNRSQLLPLEVEVTVAQLFYEQGGKERERHEDDVDRAAENRITAVALVLRARLFNRVVSCEIKLALVASGRKAVVLSPVEVEELEQDLTNGRVHHDQRPYNYFKAKAPVKEALHVVSQVFGQRPLF